MKFLVIPTNRPERLCEFFRAWQGKGGWDRIIVVHDSERVPFSKFMPDVPHIKEYGWADIDRILGPSSWIISRKDSAIRCFGFLAAWHLGATSVLTLDDDCYPVETASHHFGCHLRDMVSHNVWINSAGVRTRGIPYKRCGQLVSDVNVGLWEHNADWDSVQDAPRSAYFKPPQYNWVVPHGQMIPMCGMNLCFTHRTIPLMYFPLMGEGQLYSRFDDIWAGTIVKKLLDHLGWYMSVGEPFVEHIRASDPVVNKVKESPGIEANEWFWEKVWNRSLSHYHHKTPVDCMAEIGLGLWSDEDDYIAKLGRALQVWSGLFAEKLDF